jgi:U3 small nucleolar RNA-associated protein 21
VKFCYSILYFDVLEEFGQLQFNKSSFDISAVVHPRGIKNVVLFGSRQGSLQLWNINTSKLLYTFAGWDSGVTALEQVCQLLVI